VWGRRGVREAKAEGQHAEGTGRGPTAANRAHTAEQQDIKGSPVGFRHQEATYGKKTGPCPRSQKPAPTAQGQDVRHNDSGPGSEPALVSPRPGRPSRYRCGQAHRSGRAGRRTAGQGSAGTAHPGRQAATYSQVVESSLTGGDTRRRERRSRRGGLGGNKARAAMPRAGRRDSSAGAFKNCSVLLTGPRTRTPWSAARRGPTRRQDVSPTAPAR